MVVTFFGGYGVNSGSECYGNFAYMIVFVFELNEKELSHFFWGSTSHCYFLVLNLWFQFESFKIHFVEARGTILVFEEHIDIRGDTGNQYQVRV